MGKELKTPSEILGNVLTIETSGVVHVHATPAKEIVVLDDDDDDDEVIIVEPPPVKRRRVR